MVCEGRVDRAKSFVTLPAVAVVWGTNRRTAGLAAKICKVYSAASENST